MRALFGALLCLTITGCSGVVDPARSGLGLSIGGGALAMKPGETTQLQIQVTGASNELYVVNYASDDEAVATVSSSGTLSALAAGSTQVRVTATLLDTGATASASAGVTVSGTGTTPTPTPSGDGHALRSLRSGLCIAAPSTANGTKLAQAPCANGLRFVETATSSGVELKLSGTDTCVRIAEGAAMNGSALELAACDGSASQRFATTSYGAGVRAWTSQASGLCLDAGNHASATSGILQQWSCDTSATEQRFSSDSGGATPTTPTPTTPTPTTPTTPTPNGVLVASSDWAKEAAIINQRTGTNGPGAQADVDGVGTGIWLTRSVEAGMEVVTRDGVRYLQTTIADGRNWEGQGYDRSEYSIGVTFEDAHQYTLEWRGMIPDAWPTTGTVTVMMQVHMKSDTTCPSFSISADGGHLYFLDNMDPSIPNQTPQFWISKRYDLGSYADLVGVPLTFRLTLVSAQNGYVKFEKDGVTIMERHGRTTDGSGGDWLKDGTLYDWDRDWVDPSQGARGHSVSLLTEYSKIWRAP